MERKFVTTPFYFVNFEYYRWLLLLLYLGLIPRRLLVKLPLIIYPVNKNFVVSISLKFFTVSHND